MDPLYIYIYKDESGTHGLELMLQVKHVIYRSSSIFQMLHPRFSVDSCNWRVSCGTPRICTICGIDNEMYGIVD